MDVCEQVQRLLRLLAVQITTTKRAFAGEDTPLRVSLLQQGLARPDAEEGRHVRFYQDIPVEFGVLAPSCIPTPMIEWRAYQNRWSTFLPLLFNS